MTERELLEVVLVSPINEASCEDEIIEQTKKYVSTLVDLTKFISTGGLPDFFVSIGEEILILELFEFNASKTEKFGSLQNYRVDQILKDWDKYSKSDCLSETILMKKYENKNKYDLGYLIDNFYNNFNEHYSRIERYKERLVEERLVESGAVVKTAFIAVNTTELGCFKKIRQGIKVKLDAMYVSRVLEVFSFFTCKKKIDYIVEFNYYSQESMITDMRNHDNKVIIEKLICINDIDFLAFEPTTIALRERI